MDIQLKELIEKIKTEGVKTAEENAQSIIHKADKRGDEIVANAHKEASAIIAKAKAEAVRLEQTGKEALKQAGRDLVLNVKKQITNLFNAVTQAQIQDGLNVRVLEEAILAMLSAWNENTVADLQVLLSPKDREEVEKYLRSKLADRINQGVEIASSKGISTGFRIGEKDGSAYFNFTAEGISEVLSEYLNPRLTEILNEAVAEEK